MSATPITVAATLRGKQAVQEVRELFERLEQIDEDIQFHGIDDDETFEPVGVVKLTHAEIESVLQQRRAEVLRQLENKGIRIAPDPEPVYLGELPKAAEA